MQPATHTSELPWYKHLWPWVILGMLGASICVSLTMVKFALSTQDSLITDNYYEEGKGINRSLEREHLAQQLKLQASIRFDSLTGDVDLRLTGNSRPQKLRLNILSPTVASLDKHLELLPSPAEPDRYLGSLDTAVKGRRYLELLGQENNQDWRLFEIEIVAPDETLILGDEPLKGDRAEPRP